MNLLIALLTLTYGTFISGPETEADRCCPILFSTQEIDISYDPLYYQLYFIPISYDEYSGSFKFESKKKITYVELTSETGEKSKLLVLSQKIQLNKSMFKGNNMTIAFHFEGDKGGKEAFAMHLDYKN